MKAPFAAAVVATVLVVVTSPYVWACSCGRMANAQQASSAYDSIVAKVRTKSRPGGGLGVLVIERLYKGQYSSPEIEVKGQDGLNCAGRILPTAHGSWIAVIVKRTDRYEIASCADASVVFDAEGRVITVVADKAVTMSEQEFSDFVNQISFPGMKLECRAVVSRTDAQGTDETVFEEVKSTPIAKTAKLEFQKDLSDKGLQYPFEAKMFLDRADYSNPSEYTWYSTLSEPFFGVGTSSDYFNKIDLNRPREMSLKMHSSRGQQHSSASVKCEVKPVAPAN